MSRLLVQARARVVAVLRCHVPDQVRRLAVRPEREDDRNLESLALVSSSIVTWCPTEFPPFVCVPEVW